jgi:hypothetical protein
MRVFQLERKVFQPEWRIFHPEWKIFLPEEGIFIHENSTNTTAKKENNLLFGTRSQKNACKPRRIPHVHCTLCWAFLLCARLDGKGVFIKTKDLECAFAIIVTPQTIRSQRRMYKLQVCFPVSCLFFTFLCPVRSIRN